MRSSPRERARRRPGKLSGHSLRSVRQTSREQRKLGQQSRLFQKEKNMGTQTLKSKVKSGAKGAVGRLFVLGLSRGRVFSVNPDGSDRKVIVNDCPFPDGIVVDAEAGHIYWTNMGAPKLNDGSIERADLDGQNR